MSTSYQNDDHGLSFANLVLIYFLSVVCLTYYNATAFDKLAM